MESGTDTFPDLLANINPEDTSLEPPDLELARQSRRHRTHNAMKVVNPVVTKEVLPQADDRSLEVRAATVIQAAYRGHLGRKQYIIQLYNLFQKEEAMRLEKRSQQVEEGQLLVENHRLEVQLDEDSTTRRNKTRHYLADVITIQRAWRRYKRLEHHQVAAPIAEDGHHGNMSQSPSDTDSETSSNGLQAMSISSPDDSDYVNLKDSSLGKWTGSKTELEQNNDRRCVGILGAPHIDPEPDSTISDCSEMAEPIKEHLANVQIIQKQDLTEGNTMFPTQVVCAENIVREPNETDEEYAKRVRKINYLSLAQEFAVLKKIEASAVGREISRTKTGMMSDSSVTETDSSERYDTESGETSNVCTPMDGNDIFLSERMHGRDRCVTRADMDQVTDKLQGATLTTTDDPWHEANTDSVDNIDGHRNQNLRGNHGNQACSLPFHNTTGPLDRKEPSVGDFDVYNIETTLPQMDWDMLEEQLQRAAEEERQKKESRRTDRDEIRRKLAMAGPDEEYYGGERMYKKPNLQTRLQSGMNLQLCFMNEVGAEDRGSGNTAGNSQQSQGEQPPCTTAKSKTQPPATAPSDNSVCPPRTTNELQDEDFFTKQAKLQAEARMALAQVRPMAHMQLEVERQMRKKSPIAEIVQTGIPGFSDGKRRKLRIQLMQQMNVAQLQVVVNDLHAQIEGLNEELVKLLVERDDLHMEQDSMLVDIEDFTRRTQETKLFPQS